VVTIRWAAAATLLAFLAVAALGCSSSTAPGQSLTPAITAPEGAADLRGLLLTGDQLRQAGLPADLRTVPDDQVSSYENPDPRGPCGAPMDAHELYSGGIRYHAAATVLAFEAVGRATNERAEQLMDAVVADVTPRCPEFISRTNTGVDQANHFGAPIDLSGLGDQAVGWQSTVTVQDQHAHGYIGMVRKGDTIVTLVLVAPTLLDISVVRHAVQAAADQLSSATTTTSV